MRIDIISILPDIFDAPLSASMVGIARQRGALELAVHDLRHWALPGVHRQVDDAPYGGGPGMVLRPEPFYDAVRAVKEADPRSATTVLMSPQGEPLTQSRVETLAMRERLLILCGRYEGFDERVRALADVQLSVGDYVLTGGELPAMVLVDAVSRLLPGVLGHDESVMDESFTSGLLEYPQYTRPAVFQELAVPDVLVSGDHARIAAWRRREAIRRTAQNRPDLLQSADLTEDERAFAEDVIAGRGDT